MLTVGVLILLGFLLFFLVERFATVHLSATAAAAAGAGKKTDDRESSLEEETKGTKEAKGTKGGKGVKGASGKAKPASTGASSGTRKRVQTRSSANRNDDDDDGEGDEGDEGEHEQGQEQVQDNRSNSHGHSHGHSHSHLMARGPGPDDKDGNSVWGFWARLSAAGWLNLLADSMHNFTDGVALGASFGSAGKAHSSGSGGSSGGGGGSALGTAALLSVLFHEIPHELSDFAILVESGLSKWEAIRAQFLTALAAFAGCCVGLYAERNEYAEMVMLAMTSGGFLYIATVNILPIVVRGSDGGSDRGSGSGTSVLQVCLEGVSFVVGVGFMVAVALLETH
jgi:zinc transporter ZupT